MHRVPPGRDERPGDSYAVGAVCLVLGLAVAAVFLLVAAIG
jgi:hypothetical protein